MEYTCFVLCFNRTQKSGSQKEPKESSFQIIVMLAAHLKAQNWSFQNNVKFTVNKLVQNEMFVYIDDAATCGF